VANAPFGDRPRECQPLAYGHRVPTLGKLVEAVDDALECSPDTRADSSCSFQSRGSGLRPWRAENETLRSASPSSKGETDERPDIDAADTDQGHLEGG
jgi:hypothetical protein